jgi:hypothetical protein
MSYSQISSSTSRPRDLSRTVGIPLDTQIVLPSGVMNSERTSFGTLIDGYTLSHWRVDSSNSDVFRHLDIPRRQYFPGDGWLLVSTRGDPKKLVSTNPNIPVASSFWWLCMEYTSVIKTRTDSFTAEAYKVAHFARMILTQLSDTKRRTFLIWEKKNALNLLERIERAHNTWVAPEGFEDECRDFYSRIMARIGESLLDDVVIASLSWERRWGERKGDGATDFPYNEYPFSCRCWVLGIAFSLLR